MRGRNVYQVSFPGCHGNLGWIEEDEGLVHAPFAWMIQQVHTHLNISFDEAKLAARFPSYRPTSTSTLSPNSNLNMTLTSNSMATSTLTPTAQWHHGRIQRLNTGLLAIMGKKARKPGYVNCPGGATDLKIHIGARLRNDQDGANTVPGYTLMAPVTGKPYWARRPQQSWWGSRTDSDRYLASNSLNDKGRRSTSWTKTAERIEEAEVGALEARLLGLPDEVVSSL